MDYTLFCYIVVVPQVEAIAKSKGCTFNEAKVSYCCVICKEKVRLFTYFTEEDIPNAF